MAKKFIPIGCQTLNCSCRVDLFLPFNCTDVAPKCDEDIVTEAAEPNRYRSSQAGTPLLSSPSWLYKRHGLRKLLLLQSHGMVAASTIGWTVDSFISAS
jgi:hypothetical protein